MGKTFRRKTNRKMRKSRKLKSKRSCSRGGGGNESKPKQDTVLAEEIRKAQENAARNYHMRVNAWKGVRFGPEFQQYMEWCNQQYQLECIPESLRQGSMDAEASRIFDENMEEHRKYGY
jgi:hypothetical protein